MDAFEGAEDYVTRWRTVERYIPAQFRNEEDLLGAHGLSDQVDMPTGIGAPFLMTTQWLLADRYRANLASLDVDASMIKYILFTPLS
jgi:hypothetical protein